MFQIAFTGLLVWQIFALAGSARGQTLLDPTFDGDGKVTANIGFFQDKGHAAVLQPDGKIVVVGSANANPAFPQSYQISVGRFNADGTFDTTFDGDGKLTVTLDTSKPSEATAVALQPDGKIVVVGYVGELPPNGSPDVAVLRFNANGSLDTSFDGDGSRMINFDVQNAWDVGGDVLIQPDGKIVLAARLTAVGFGGFVVSRLHSNGSTDTDFGTGGSTRIAVSFPDFYPNIAFQSGGKIVLTGSTDTSFALARLNANGTRDAGFGTDGVILNAGGTSIAVQSDDKIVTVNFHSPSQGYLVRRYNADGTSDTSFGTNGATSINFTNLEARTGLPNDLTIQPDGKIVVAGQVEMIADFNKNLAVARLKADGSLDADFGFNGKIVTDVLQEDSANAVLYQPDGKIVAVGTSAGFASLVRYVPAGLNNVCRPVSDFNGDGRSDLAIFMPSNGYWHVSNVLLHSWGLGTDRLVPADYNGDCSTDTAVFRDGVWYIRPLTSTPIYYHFGLAGDTPVPADYDGDDLADPAVYRNGTWYINRTRDGFLAVAFGLANDRPVPADYDGDGKSDIAVYRDGTWYLLQSTGGFAVLNFGLASDKPVVGDYDGDGKSDAAVYRASEGVWYLLRSQAGFAALRWGISTDLPVPADYDGDGKTDVAVYRGGDWYLLNSSQGFQLAHFGGEGDKPVANVYVP